MRDRLPRTKQDGCLLFIQVTSWCSEQSSFDRRDRSHSFEVVPLLSCTKDITRHKSLWQFQDVNNEVDLILARAALFTMPQNVNTLTICPAHRSSLGLGWTRGTEEISEHRNFRGKWPKADRGINKNFSQFIMKRTGHLVRVTRTHRPPVRGPPLRTGSTDHLYGPPTDHPQNTITNKNKDSTYCFSNRSFVSAKFGALRREKV